MVDYITDGSQEKISRSLVYERLLEVNLSDNHKKSVEQIFEDKISI